MEYKGNIILVDDDQENLDYNSEILSNDGFNVKTAMDSKGLYQLLAKFKADILILDIVLENESGLDILQAIKSDDRYRYMLIVMITSMLKTSEQQATGLDYGADGYITRPINKREFVSRINAFMRHKVTIDQLVKSEERFKKIIDRNPDAILIVEKDGNIKFANSSAENLFKLSVDILLKRIFGYPLVIGEHTEINIVRKDEDNIVGEMRTIDIDWDDTETFLTSIRDITDKKKLLEELIKAKNQAEESERLKSSFLANMSHEIRTPMNSIIGFVDLLHDREVTGEKRDVFLSAIRKGCDRLLSTINDIIEISKIESGEAQLHMTQFSMHEAVNDMIDTFRHEIYSKGLEIKIVNKGSDDTDLVFTDKHKFESVLSNLIKNAIKFTNEGYIEVGYHFQKTQIKIYVKDTGSGIAKEKQEDIFNRFIQADNDLARPYDGSGLGLAISKAYCNILGGEIKVESIVNSGSTFTFTIKRYMTDIMISGNKPESVEDKKLRGNNILIVEDDVHNFDYLETLLTRRENVVIWAKNGHEAVEICKKNKDLDLILMDIRMPGMDGLEATQEIKKINKKVPIIAQTAFALSGDREKALEAGCTDYVAKPIKIKELFKIMSKHL